MIHLYMTPNRGYISICYIAMQNSCNIRVSEILVFQLIHLYTVKQLIMLINMNWNLMLCYHQILLTFQKVKLVKWEISKLPQ